MTSRAPARALDQALRALSAYADIDAIRVLRIPLTTRFRAITVREVALIHGSEGWAEFSPFIEYEPNEAAAWLAAALEAASMPYPPVQRSDVPINATIPVVTPQRAREIAASVGAGTAKVKVADARSSIREDCERLEAVRDALGPSGRIRVDANAAWGVQEAVAAIAELSRAAGVLEYVEQPCRSVPELAEVRSRVDVPIAADESVRRARDPMAVVRAQAADLLVVKVQPLGGVRATLRLVEQVGVPVVVSSAVETSVGLSAGLACAASVPHLDHACGLGTAGLLAGDVTDAPLVTTNGVLPAGRVHVSDERMAQYRADPERERWWLRRICAAAEALRSRQG